MRYSDPPTTHPLLHKAKVKFYKDSFATQWNSFIHLLILAMVSAKINAWNGLHFVALWFCKYLLSYTNQKFNFSKYIFESMVKNLDNVNKFLMYPRHSVCGLATYAVVLALRTASGSDYYPTHNWSCCKPSPV
ncbi:hypothetical protein Tco_0916869 [Tanacetum coccineum]